MVEVNTFKSLPLSIGVSQPNHLPKAGGQEVYIVTATDGYYIIHYFFFRQSNQSFHGLVQRLVSKEKQVLQLQSEVDRLRAQNPTDGRDAVRLSFLSFLGV